MYLEMNHIFKSFGDGENRTEVLHDITCGVEAGDICVLLGPSGSGKSTLLNILGGIETVDSGSVCIGGDEIIGLDENGLSRYRRRHLGYVFQAYNLIPNLTVRENIEVGAYLSDRPLSVDELLRVLGLWEHRNKKPNQLSGGQQQRTSIGRAVVKKPDVLLCDEPTGALDYKTSREILKLIEDVNKMYATTVVLVTHNDALRRMADQVLRLRDGRIMENTRNAAKLRAADLEW
ncbi:ABC transporter ATP-binding protein [Hornefia butyriciproducens]|uniref:ABC transporter ATP-binding protein n=1 Tax=Hornefia butyriciproducens TaxID=2652293 RepID=UPI0023F13532|nr:ABC transporter ATP-binding protein [Hornefia butyriciproducens]MDD6299160.1 ABC transporter ATP-binding protein [Hornefia butyriciproducens]